MKTKKTAKRHPASFRDPSGFLFTQDGEYYRQVNRSYAENYDQLMNSGLYEKLVRSGRMLPHQESPVAALQAEIAYKVIHPEQLGFIAYPFEWSFTQLKDAALCTLGILKDGLDAGMILKDASAYNMQFRDTRAILLDTLSFERYEEGKPWDAYRQFCQHFLAPLALMAYKDVRLHQLLRIYIDGIPLDLASQLLPWGTRFNFGLLTHIHLHARTQARFADKTVAPTNGRKMTKTGLQGLIDNLERTVRALKWEPQGTEWGDYYNATNYSRSASEHKATLVTAFLQEIDPQSVWDLGANTGRFSRIASEAGIPTVAFDIDPAAVERNFRRARKNKEKNLLPLVLDLTNPSPALGWQHEERQALLQRGPADAVLALALIHHLAISNNVPLHQLARFFAAAGEWLIIEFIPKSDSQVIRLLQTRQDIFPEYELARFQAVFGQRFHIRRLEAIQDSERHLILMQRKK